MLEDLVKDEIGHNTLVEMCLLGNIMQNLELIPEYKNSLLAEDFEGNWHRYLYDFLKSYFLRFGSEIEQDKINLLFIEYCDKNASFRKMVPSKKYFYRDIIRQTKAFGTIDEPADSHAFRSVKRNTIISKILLF